MSCILENMVDKINDMHTENSEEIFDVIHTSMHLLRARQLRALRDSEVALTHMEARVLSFFDRHPGETLSTLTAHSGRDKGQLARLLANLRERELLVARPDEQDRRNVRLSLTPTGQQIADTMRQQQHHLSRQAVQHFSAEEELQLMTLLHRVLKNLEEAEE